MLAPSVEMARIVWKRPLKKVVTEAPECLDMGWISVRLWPWVEAWERRPVRLCSGGESFFGDGSLV